MTPAALSRMIERRGLTHEEVARLTGMDRTTVTKYLSGARPITKGAEARLLIALGRERVTLPASP